MKKLKYIIAACLLIAGQAKAQVPEPVGAQEKPILLMNGTAHIGNGQVIENSFVTFENGKITNVGDAAVVRLDMTKFEVINIAGKHVYPGLILPNTTLGLEDISAVRASIDSEEVGDLNPHVRSLVAYNTDSEVIATLRYNGILLAQSTPQGDLVTGTSSIMMLEGWNWEDAQYKADDAIHLNWPTKTFGPRWWMGETEPRKNPNYQSSIDKLEKFFADAKAYSEGQPAVTNLRLEAMKGLFTGAQKLFVHADRRVEIMEGIQFAKASGATSIVLVGGTDAGNCIDFLKDNNIPVLLTDVHRIPGREDEDYDLAYKLPAILSNAGIKVGLTYETLHGSRNLPFTAGTVAAYGGISKEEALKMITSNTAQILGIDGTTGTLENGKDANIVVSEGDILDMRTSKVTSAFIMGKGIIMDGKQQMLYDRFKRKYESQK
ncbi:amidohydrolase family protein [uncultured Imperialibacter sp.]|uniref:amidohydrolase family protein n=1 Tax=uncultured Imperialibacter sp. TaxID=1672639 RepID=UPI0030DA2923|tara:strand:+ start:4167 stop:5468 length:1302 start_codon:yes stop_codon:yes gene_type:complete